VRVQRDHACQRAEQALVAAQSRLAEAEQALQAALAAHAALTTKRSRVVTPAPETGTQRGQTLALGGVYAARLYAEGRKLAARVQTAQTVVSAQARALRLAELSWQQAYAEREALERHHERFREAERKAAERAYEIETEERAHPRNLQVRT
jgi:exonuclease VII large subunit